MLRQNNGLILVLWGKGEGLSLKGVGGGGNFRKGWLFFGGGGLVIGF